MERETLELELSLEKIKQFQEIQEALDHDEPEQTFNIMLELLILGITLTSKDNPIVRLYTRNPQNQGVDFTKVICPHCNKEVPVTHQISDGFREVAMRIS